MRPMRSLKIFSSTADAMVVVFPREQHARLKQSTQTSWFGILLPNYRVKARTSNCHLSESLAQTIFHVLGDESADVPAQPEDLFHQSRTYVGIRLRGHHEHGFDTRLQAAVHESHLEFIFVVADRADTAQNR